MENLFILFKLRDWMGCGKRKLEVRFTFKAWLLLPLPHAGQSESESESELTRSTHACSPLLLDLLVRSSRVTEDEDVCTV
jgi:hypothetical protein